MSDQEICSNVNMSVNHEDAALWELLAACADGKAGGTGAPLSLASPGTAQSKPFWSSAEPGLQAQTDGAARGTLVCFGSW